MENEENEIKIKGFEGEELSCSKFTEQIGKDIIDYKFEYINNKKIIDKLQKENEELQKENEELKKENEELRIRENDNKLIISMAENEMLGYIQGYADAHNNKRNACERVVRNREYFYLYDKLKLKQHILETIKEYVHQEIVHYTEDIIDYIDDDREGNKHIIGELKEHREHWKDIEKILQNKSKEELYMNWWKEGLYE